MMKKIGLLLLVPLIAMLAIPFLVVAMVAPAGNAYAQASDCQDTTGGAYTGTATGPVRIPLVGPARVTSNFGMRVNPGDDFFGRYMLHAGIDIAQTGGPGTIVAAMAGKVKRVFTDSIGTNIVQVDVGDGITMGYYHLASFWPGLKAGEAVWPGKPLGIEGATGNASGPHLHFQIDLPAKHTIPGTTTSTTATDPRPWMAAHGVTIPQVGGLLTGAPAVTAPPTASSLGESSSPAALPVSLNTVTGSPVTGGTKPVVGQLPSSVGEYHGVAVSNGAQVIKAGQDMHLDAWTITVGVMTAMGESGMQELTYGDAAGPDSRGMFAQRDYPEIYGTLADRMNPYISSKNYFKTLIAVPGYHSMTPTHAAHAAQRNADPEHYTRWWTQAVSFVATLTADPSLIASLPAATSSAGCLNGQPVGGTAPGAPAAGQGSAAQIVAAGQTQLGVPYSWGGGSINGPTKGVYTSSGLDGTNTVGFDCSGLVLFSVYRGIGVQMPRTADSQIWWTGNSHVTISLIPRDYTQMRPGDLIGFSENGTGAPGSFGHIGIYVGGGQMLEAPHPGDVVKIFNLQTSSSYQTMAWRIIRLTPTGH